MHCFAVLQAVRYHSQCERLGGSQGFLAGPPVDRNTGQNWNVSYPSPVVFTRELDLKVKRLGLSRLLHRFKLSLTGLRRTLVRAVRSGQTDSEGTVWVRIPAATLCAK